MNRRFLFSTLLALLLAVGLSLTATAQTKVELVTKLEQIPGNIAVTPDGRVIISQHQFGQPKYRVMEVLGNGKIRPFPNEQWSQAPGKDGIGLDAVLGLRADANGIVWMLDNGMTGGTIPKVVAWDTRRNELARVIYLPPPVTAPNSFHNDLAVDLVHDALYLADVAGKNNSAIVVVDLKTGSARRVLEGHSSVVPENVKMVIDGKLATQIDADGKEFEPRLGLNPITIDPANEWLYYGAMHGTSIYRVRTVDLLNAQLSTEELGKRVERYGEKPVSGGISIDSAGNVYVTDLQSNAVGVVSPNGAYRRLIRDDEMLSWPDGMSYSPNGYFYLTISKLHRTPPFNGGKDESKPPYYIVRFRSLAPSTVGR